MTVRLSLAWVFMAWAMSSVAADKQYDIAITGGRVIDPATGLNELRNVGIIGDGIALISKQLLRGKVHIDARGKIVTAGFIDLHSHAQTQSGQQLQVRDGVTTALDLEAGAYPVGAVGNQIADQAIINFGASAAYAAMRSKVLSNQDRPYLFFGNQRTSFKDSGFTDTLSDADIDRVLRHVGIGLDQGGLGIGVLLDYMADAVSDRELAALFGLAASRKAPLFIHIKRGIAGDVGGLVDVIELARASGASVHICHLNASAMGGISEFLQKIDAARQAGVDISAESYPYNAGSTAIGADVFNRNWQQIFAISYGDVQLAETGEYFTRSSWDATRTANPGATIIHHYGREAWTREAMLAPGMMVGSDAMPVFSTEVKSHPRGTGTFSRVLAEYVRGAAILTMEDALAKMSYLPAQRLVQVAPRFARKGRMQVGADADVVVFDAEIIADRATYAQPYQASVGMAAVLVNGRIVVRDGNVVEGVFPGRLMVGADQAPLHSRR